jgi:hypothetical protein
MRFARAFVLSAFLPAVAMLTGCGSAGGNSVIPKYAMGERAQAGPIIYTVFESRWMPQLGSDATARIPKNRFFLLRVSMVNSGSNETVVPALTLIDDNGERHAELSEGEGVPQWIGYLRRIKPADTLTGNIVFDVPPRHYKVEVTDEMEEKKAIIDIPLSFNSDDVTLPTPGAPDSNPLATPISPK